MENFEIQIADQDDLDAVLSIKKKPILFMWRTDRISTDIVK